MHEKLIQTLENQLQHEEFKLSSLLEISSAINSNQPIEKLYKILSFVLREQLGISKVLLIHKQETWETLIKIRVKGNLILNELVNHLHKVKEITNVIDSKSNVLNQFDYIVPVQQNDQILAYLLLSGEKIKKLGLVQLTQTLQFIQTLANIVIVAIENKRMVQLSIKQAKLKKELEIASEMQKMLFPDDLPSNKKLDISAKHTSRHEVGGDYYDFIPISENEYILCIGDVSGKGISAAMLMANFQATLRTLYSFQKFELEEIIHELNKKVYRNAKGEKFITFFIAHYNVTTRRLEYINAGHNHPFISNGSSYKLLNKGTIGLGMLDELPFLEKGEAIIDPNATLVMYTDGIIELENSKNEFFELDRLTKLVHQYYPLKMEDLNAIIFSKLDEWRGKRNYVDDTAIFSCRFF
jgi:sigma-B regulation protein RsbU (phosphoserine phosphatase)